MTEPGQEPAATPQAPAAPAEPVAPQEPNVNDPAPPTHAQAPTEPQAPPPDPTAEPAAAPTERVVPAADGYTLPEGVPQELGQFANQHGFTQEQLDATLTQMGQYMQNTRQAELQALRGLGEAHLKNWGDRAQYNLSLAKRALAQNDPDGELSKALDASGYGNHPAVLNFLQRVGESMKEGGFLKTAINRPPGEKTAAEAMYGENHPTKA